MSFPRGVEREIADHRTSNKEWAKFNKPLDAVLLQKSEAHFLLLNVSTVVCIQSMGNPSHVERGEGAG
ncbi:hypothetical protein PISMIDRAFT_688144 [Pisolithus microcarpus 441]|uniref:Uncharacterized protein n=1 Tax=Pisolithus microcarpus 441 TaxID=765257 RepID=A0A0C9YK09_9AGAM|nr:hypothetical protein PISMIDRAFT_688144 [Pisolithus microcarpus 441]